MQSTKRMARVRLLLRQVWSEGDLNAIDQYIADSYTIHHDPGDPWEGKVLDRDGYKDRVRKSRAPFPDQRFEIHELAESEMVVIVTWHWFGTHREDLPALPANGRLVRMSGSTVYYFDGEKISGHWQVADRLGVYRQLRGT